MLSCSNCPSRESRSNEERIGAVLGFIPLARFDPALARFNDMFLALWKRGVTDGTPAMGFEVLARLIADQSPRLVLAIGLTDAVAPLYRAMRFDVGRCDHFVLLNPAATPYRLLENAPSPRPVSAGDGTIRTLTNDALRSRETGLAELFELSEPRKSVEYLIGRYGTHPYYRYHIFELAMNDAPMALAIGRIVSGNGVRALRIVDFIGSEMALVHSADALMTELSRLQCEYADLVAAGIDREVLLEAGFVDRRDFPEFIVPMHFEPLESRNVDLNYGVLTRGTATARLRLLRGDGDQDRPNRLPDEHSRP